MPMAQDNTSKTMDYTIGDGPQNRRGQIIRNAPGQRVAFQYAPLELGKIRLLKTSIPVVDLSCSLQCFSIRDVPPFVALSYAWGAGAKTQTLFCKNNGIEEEFSTFLVSGAAFDALSKLHVCIPEGYWIWIDAICINQDSPEEKSHQIALMPRIYSQAEYVYCWLGETSSGDEHVYKFLSHAETGNRDIVAEAVGYRDSDDPSLRLSIETKRHLTRFFNRPWFHRLWVVQEIMMAREIYLLCGNRVYSWAAAATLVDSLNKWVTQQESPEARRAMHGMRGVWEIERRRKEAGGPILRGFSHFDFVRLLLWACDREVTEPVDRIWALLGLAPQQLQEAAAPLIDYSEEARRNYLATYKAFAEKFLLQDRSLCLLSLLSQTPKHDDLPSWCPHFTLRSEGWQRNILLETDENQFSAGYSSREPPRPSVRFLSNSAYLGITGFLIDQVAVVKTHNGMVDLKSRVDFNHECHMLAEKTHAGSFASYEALKAHSRTIIADQRLRSSPIRGPSRVSIADIHTIYPIWKKHMEGQILGFSQRDHEHENLSWYNDVLVTSCIHRCYVSTVRGRIGLAPIGTAPGDWICIFHGGAIPFVVRRRLVFGRKWRLIGDAYLHGVMHGEALSSGMRMMTTREFVFK